MSLITLSAVLVEPRNVIFIYASEMPRKFGMSYLCFAEHC